MHLKRMILGLIVLAIGLTTCGFVNQSFTTIGSACSAEQISAEKMQYYLQSRPEKSASPSTLKKQNTYPMAR